MRLINIFLLFALSSLAIANDTIDANVLKFEKERFSQNKRITIKDVKVNLKKEMPQKGWYGYIIDLEAQLGGNDVKAKDIVFSNGELIAPEVFDIKTGMSLKELMKPKLTSAYYSIEHLIAGNHNAKDKIVVFSDPLCPFCMDYVPDVIKHVKKYKDKIALYYYHFPLLKIHPAAGPLSKLMILAKEKGVKDVEEKVYKKDWEKYFDSKQTDEEKILNAFNKEMETSILIAELKDERLTDLILKDVNLGEEMMVQGTPTIFVNGVQDKSKLQYEMLGK